MTSGRFFGILLLALTAAGLGYAASYWYQYPLHEASSREPHSQEEPSAAQGQNIVAQGRLQPAEGTIAVSGLPGELVTEVRAEVGQRVKAGDELAVLGSRRIREAEHELAQARQAQSEAQLNSQLQLAEQEVAAAKLSEKQAQLQAAEIPPQEVSQVVSERLELARERLKRLERLRANPGTREAISESDVKQQSLLVQQLEAEVLQNEKQRETAEEAQQLALEAARLESRVAELKKVGVERGNPAEVLAKTTELARLTLAATAVEAPLAGQILEIYVRPGERIADTPLLLMADLDRMVCVAEVHEADLQRIEIDEKVARREGRLVPAAECRATLESAALGGRKLTGTVREIGRLIGAPKLRDPNPLARRDLRTAEVIIELDPESSEIAQRFVHLQVRVTIEPPQPAGQSKESQSEVASP